MGLFDQVKVIYIGYKIMNRWEILFQNMPKSLLWRHWFPSEVKPSVFLCVLPLFALSNTIGGWGGHNTLSLGPNFFFLNIQENKLCRVELLIIDCDKLLYILSILYSSGQWNFCWCRWLRLLWVWILYWNNEISYCWDFKWRECESHPLWILVWLANFSYQHTVQIFSSSCLSWFSLWDKWLRQISCSWFSDICRSFDFIMS